MVSLGAKVSLAAVTFLSAPTALPRLAAETATGAGAAGAGAGAGGCRGRRGRCFLLARCEAYGHEGERRGCGWLVHVANSVGSGLRGDLQLLPGKDLVGVLEDVLVGLDRSAVHALASPYSLLARSSTGSRRTSPRRSWWRWNCCRPAHWKNRGCRSSRLLVTGGCGGSLYRREFHASYRRSGMARTPRRLAGRRVPAGTESVQLHLRLDLPARACARACRAPCARSRAAPRCAGDRARRRRTSRPSPRRGICSLEMNPMSWPTVS